MVMIVLFVVMCLLAGLSCLAGDHQAAVECALSALIIKAAKDIHL